MKDFFIKDEIIFLLCAYLSQADAAINYKGVGG